MPEKIVIALDGSLMAEAVLPHVTRLVGEGPAELILVQAVNPLPVETYAAILDSALAAARKYLAGIEQSLAWRGFKVRSVARGGIPIDTLLSIAREEGASMIALATHGRTGLSRFILGSVAEHVIRESPVPVLAVRPFWTYEVAPPEGRPFRNILVPVEGSELSAGVIGPAVELAGKTGATIILLSVIEPGSDPSTRDSVIHELRKVESGIREKGVSTVVWVVEGDPAEKIGETCRFHKVDLIAMATHARSGLSRLVTGSVTEQVLRHSKVPILIVNLAAAASGSESARAVLKEAAQVTRK